MLRLFSFLFFVSATSFSQIPRDASVVIVKGVTFNQVCSALLDSGYRIESRDIEMQTVKTENKLFPIAWNAAYRIHVRVKDSTAYLSGTFTAPYSTAIFGSNTKDPLFKDDPVYNLTNNKGETKKKSLPAVPFMEVNKFALSFGKPVEYMVQKK